ncbi:hypothetical protein L210DRAFT_2359210 [Boletus edulis BED1]|uniref:Heme haloperoxidase family profile domain-containing protein n=1 Tax=Boletus edulis BED1 TaxID=1328754 RepID=A0AAD4GCP3_BOLED|nr:hypothetical protein L210DRAFT_2359210 [Boletus edulis BED1]
MNTFDSVFARAARQLPSGWTCASSTCNFVLGFSARTNPLSPFFARSDGLIVVVSLAVMLHIDVAVYGALHLVNNSTLLLFFEYTSIRFQHLINFPEYRSLAGLSPQEGRVVARTFNSILGDIRGPCPGLNTLASHGYINRTGVTTPGDIIIEFLIWNSPLRFLPHLFASVQIRPQTMSPLPDLTLMAPSKIKFLQIHILVTTFSTRLCSIGSFMLTKKSEKAMSRSKPQRWTG